MDPIHDLKLRQNQSGIKTESTFRKTCVDWNREIQKSGSGWNRSRPHCFEHCSVPKSAQDCKTNPSDSQKPKSVTNQSSLKNKCNAPICFWAE